MHAFFQSDEGGWSWDIPERVDDETPQDRARVPFRRSLTPPPAPPLPMPPGGTSAPGPGES